MDVVTLVDQGSNLLTHCVTLASCLHTSSDWEFTTSQGGPFQDGTALFARKLFLVLS